MLIKEKISLIFGVPDLSFFDGLTAKKIFVAELRPSLEGIKIVANALLKKGIQPVVICDNMLAFCMQRGLIKDVHIFYKSLNKKTAICRTGSLMAALCAKIHHMPVYLHQGKKMRFKRSSLFEIDGKQVASSHIKTYVPLTEEVPLSLIEKIVN